MLGSIGKYELESILGKGTSSTVYLALDTSTQRQVALKVMDAVAMRDPALGGHRKNQFLNEASLVGKLAHPNIVALLDAVTSDEPRFIAMEYVPGGNLTRYTSPATLMPVADAIEIAFKCCCALDYASRSGVIHRDIKPANILVVSNTDIKLADFGAALLRDTDAKDIRALGSPAYMSPEQTNGMALGPKSDMFMLGVVLFELLTGKRPFDGKSVSEIMFNIRNTEPGSVCALRSDVPEALEPILLRALAKTPYARYPTWADFALELSRIGRFSVQPQKIPDSAKFTYLKSMEMLKAFGDTDLWQLVHASRWMRLPAHNVIIREGEPGLGFFLLAQGEVKVTKRGRLLGVLRNGECFGEMSYIKGRNTPRHATVEAMTDVVLAGFDSHVETEVSASCQSNLQRALLHVLVDRLAMADARIARREPH